MSNFQPQDNKGEGAQKEKEAVFNLAAGGASGIGQSSQVPQLLLGLGDGCCAAEKPLTTNVEIQQLITIGGKTSGTKLFDVCGDAHLSDT